MTNMSDSYGTIQAIARDKDTILDVETLFKKVINKFKYPTHIKGFEKNILGVSYLTTSEFHQATRKLWKTKQKDLLYYETYFEAAGNWTYTSNVKYLKDWIESYFVDDPTFILEWNRILRNGLILIFDYTDHEPSSKHLVKMKDILVFGHENILELKQNKAIPNYKSFVNYSNIRQQEFDYTANNLTKLLMYENAYDFTEETISKIGKNEFIKALKEFNFDEEITQYIEEKWESRKIPKLIEMLNRNDQVIYQKIDDFYKDIRLENSLITIRKNRHLDTIS